MFGLFKKRKEEVKDMTDKEKQIYSAKKSFQDSLMEGEEIEIALTGRGTNKVNVSAASMALTNKRVLYKHYMFNKPIKVVSLIFNKITSITRIKGTGGPYIRYIGVSITTVNSEHLVMLKDNDENSKIVNEFIFQVQNKL